MSKSKQNHSIDLNDEASKLLEKALSSFDGIILGNSIQQVSLPEIEIIFLIIKEILLIIYEN